MRRFLKNERGAVMIYAALGLPVILGIIGFAVDSANLYSLDTDLQNAADAAALAGAKELDGGTDATTRATAAAQAAVSNFTVMSSSTVISINTPTYHGDGCPVAALTGSVSQVSRVASCIRVTTQSKSARTSFIRFVGFSSTINDVGRAAARSTYTTCQSSPLMVCESGTVNLNGATVGKQYKLTTPASNSGAIFGRLIPPTGSGVPSSSGGHEAETYLGYAGGGSCFTNVISPDTGNANGTTAKGVNTRFDIYPNGNSNPNLATFPPAPQSIGGLKECTGNQTLSTGGFPRDSSFNGWEGNGNWSRTTYRDTFHTAANDLIKSQLGSTSTLTRYETYLKELNTTAATAEAATFTAAQIATLKSQGYFPPDVGSGGNQEHSAPACYSGPATAFALSRRIIYVAVSNNCGTSISTGLIVSRYAKFFLTEATNNDDVWAEFIGWVNVEGNANSAFRHKVELVQ